MSSASDTNPSLNVTAENHSLSSPAANQVEANASVSLPPTLPSERTEAEVAHASRSPPWRKKDAEIEQYKRDCAKQNEKYIKLLEERKPELHLAVEQLQAQVNVVAAKWASFENKLMAVCCEMENVENRLEELEALAKFSWAVERAKELIGGHMGITWGALTMMVKDGESPEATSDEVATAATLGNEIYTTAKHFFGLEKNDWDLVRSVYNKRIRRLHRTEPKSTNELVALLAQLPAEFAPHLAMLRQFAEALMDRHYYYTY